MEKDRGKGKGPSTTGSHPHARNPEKYPAWNSRRISNYEQLILNYFSRFIVRLFTVTRLFQASVTSMHIQQDNGPL